MERVAIISLGCPKNTVDSEILAAAAGESGFELTTDVKKADIAVVNTCAFIEPAVQEAIDTILDLAELQFINSEGIGFITDVYNRFTAQNKKILIINASTQIMDIFNLVGLNQLITCLNSEEEAANSL